MKPEEIQDLKELIEFLKAYQVAEFDLDRGDMKIRLKFEQPKPAPAEITDLAERIAAARARVDTLEAAAPSAPAPAATAPAAEADADIHLVKSPIVGTYYGSPSPGAAAFVSPGDRVEKGQVICIVEAMKLMNEIESDVAGEVVKSFVSNGQPVEFGQPLFSIRMS
ncbi:MAG TPA: acetyl-CoA carboxylase biotin carboxyl carrier protein [Terracidiphilus sp.]|nr:acetyl-CoA carboxylase biotin carboxyl carrier protein [Terracidiphilus sp.]